MVDRPNKPSALAATPAQHPQAQVDITHDNQRVSAVLPTGESVEVLLYGATVISWKDAHGDEKLWLSDAAKLDGSKAVRGGIPLVFPVFGTAPDHAATSKLPQHGFARNSRWEFMGKSSSESSPNAASADLSIKLDFGLSTAALDDATKKLWPHGFSLIYSVTLDRRSLSTSMVITNDDSKPWDFQVLMHTYLRVKDITQVGVTGLTGATYVDKVDGAKTKKQADGAIAIAGETDRVYRPEGGSATPVVVVEAGKEVFGVARDNLAEVVVWNPWSDKAAGMGDFAPKDGYKTMLCVEPGSVAQWQVLEPREVYEGTQTITLL